jgi:hypothetical protein
LASSATKPKASALSTSKEKIKGDPGRAGAPNSKWLRKRYTNGCFFALKRWVDPFSAHLQKRGSFLYFFNDFRQMQSGGFVYGSGSYGVYGFSSNNFGVYGSSGYVGVYGSGTSYRLNGSGTYGVAGTGSYIGVFGTSTDGTAIVGNCTNGTGGNFFSNNGYGLVAGTGRTDKNWAGVFNGNVYAYGAYQTSD